MYRQQAASLGPCWEAYQGSPPLQRGWQADPPAYLADLECPSLPASLLVASSAASITQPSAPVNSTLWRHCTPELTKCYTRVVLTWNRNNNGDQQVISSCDLFMGQRCAGYSCSIGCHDDQEKESDATHTHPCTPPGALTTP